MFVRERFFSFAMVLSVGFSCSSLAINAWLAAMGTWFTGWLPSLILQVVSTVISWVIITALFAGIYKVLPDVTIEWRDVAGAAVTSLLFNLGKVVIGLYLGSSTIASAYGAAGSLVILLIWVYYSAQIFSSAEFTQSICESLWVATYCPRKTGATWSPLLTQPKTTGCAAACCMWTRWQAAHVAGISNASSLCSSTSATWKRTVLGKSPVQVRAEF